jgi:hypothetical protein
MGKLERHLPYKTVIHTELAHRLKVTHLYSNS